MSADTLNHMTEALITLKAAAYNPMRTRILRALGGRKGGRPPTHPAIEIAVMGDVLDPLRTGSLEDVADAHGIGRRTIYSIRQRNEHLAEQIKAEALREVLTQAREATRARMTDACADPGESKTAPQSYRVSMEAAGVIGKTSMRDLHVHGDVNTTNNVDARQVVIAETAEQRAADLEQLRRRLG